MQFISLAAIIGGFASTVVARDFYIFAGSRQFCPCSAGLTCPCTNSAISGIAPVDDFDCDPLLDTYIQLGGGPESCNNGAEYPVTDRFEMNVAGCRFGDSTGTITFSLDASGTSWNIHVPGSENEELIRATCVAPDTCVVGDEDSGVLFDSKVCLAGIGEQDLVDAQYLCSDFTANTNDLLICP